MKKLTAILMTLCLLAALPAFAAAETEAEEAETPATLLDLVREKIEDAADLVVMTEDDLFDIIGIDPADCEDFVYLAAEDALSGRELVVVIAKDEETAALAEEMLQHYLESRMRETRNYLPDAYQALSEAKVVREGLCVILSVAAPGENDADVLLKLSEE